jgi:hypothetical protein
LLIDCAAMQLGTSRSALFRSSALQMVRLLQHEGSILVSHLLITGDDND